MRAAAVVVPPVPPFVMGRVPVILSTEISGMRAASNVPELILEVGKLGILLVDNSPLILLALIAAGKSPSVILFFVATRISGVAPSVKELTKEPEP